MGLWTFPTRFHCSKHAREPLRHVELLTHDIDPEEKRDAAERTKKAATEHIFQNEATAWAGLRCQEAKGRRSPQALFYSPSLRQLLVHWSTLPS